MSAYYNEHDPFAAQWLRFLILDGQIADGVVDERDIRDVRPSELMGFRQCHFFAGVGVWSYALRRAGWPDDRPVWTGSCPCQPFSAAGKGGGFDDERHLWPAWFHLIEQCGPERIFGEQVASKDADVWIDLVQDDLEAVGYAVGAVPFPSAGVGAPHIRDRLYWVADTADTGCEWGRSSETRDRRRTPRLEPERLCDVGRLGYAISARLEGLGSGHRAEIERDREVRSIAAAGESGGLADNNVNGRDQAGERQSPTRNDGAIGDGGIVTRASAASPTNGHWRDADWLACRDGRWRPVEPGTFPLAHGASARVGRLRAYGNAINAEAAVTFIEATI